MGVGGWGWSKSTQLSVGGDEGDLGSPVHCGVCREAHGVMHLRAAKPADLETEAAAVSANLTLGSASLRARGSACKLGQCSMSDLNRARKTIPSKSRSVVQCPSRN